MVTNDVLIDAFNRIQDAVHDVLTGLSDENLRFRPGKDANSIAWLIWHLARVQDSQIAELREAREIYTSGGWAAKFKLPLEDTDTGYGHTSEQVAQVSASSELLQAYYDAVHKATLAYITDLEPGDYARVIDRNWNPPVTLAIRLISTVADDLQHVGQAAYVRGLLGLAQ